MTKIFKKIMIFAFALCLVLGLTGILVACTETPPEEPTHTTHVDNNNDGKCDECGEDMPNVSGGDECACDECDDDCECTDCDGTDCDCHENGNVGGGCECEGCDEDACECTDCDDADCECDGCDHDDPDLTFTEEYIGKWKLTEGDDTYTLTIKEHRFTLKKGNEKLDVEVTTEMVEETYCDVTVVWDDCTYSVLVRDAILGFRGSYFDEEEFIDVWVYKYFINTVLPTDLTVNSALDGVWVAYGMPDITVEDGVLYYGEDAVSLIAASLEDYSEDGDTNIYAMYIFSTADGEILVLSASISDYGSYVYLSDLSDTFNAEYVPEGELMSALSEYVGTWSAAVEFGMPEAYVLTITEDDVTVTLNGASVASSYSVGVGGVVTLTFGGVDYTLELESEYLLTLSSEDDTVYFLQSPRPTDLTVNTVFAGEWFAQGAEHISISEQGVLTYGGAEVTILAEKLGYGWVPVYSYYFVTEDDDVFCLEAVASFEGMSLTLTDLNGELYVNYYSLANYVGTWTMVHEMNAIEVYTLVITGTEVKVYNGEVDPANLLTSSFAFDGFGMLVIEFAVEGDTTEFEVNLESDFCLSLTVWTESDAIAFYFLREGAPTMFVSSDLAGTWEAEDAEELVISVDGTISYGGVFGLVVGAAEEYGYYSYRVLFGTQLAVIEASGLGTEWESFVFYFGGEYYEMSATSREAVYVPAEYRNTTWSGDGHTVYVDEDGNVYIDDDLCELLSVQDWGYPYCTVVWNGAEWILEFNGNTASLHKGYDDWYELTKEGASSSVEVPAALLGTTWTGVGDNSFATKTYGKTITVEFAQDGTITVTIGDDVYTATIKQIAGDYITVLIDGDEVDWDFTNGLGGNTFESSGSGYAFTATKDGADNQETYTVKFYANEEKDPEIGTLTYGESTQFHDGNGFNALDTDKRNYTFAYWYYIKDDERVPIAGTQTIPDLLLAAGVDGTTLEVYAFYTLSDTVELDTLEKGGGWVETVYVYPEALQVGDFITITGDLSVTNNADGRRERWQGIFLDFSNAEDNWSRVAAFRYDWYVLDFENNRAPWTVTNARLTTSWVVDETNGNGWWNDVDRMAAAGYSYFSAVIYYPNPNLIKIVYILKSVFAPLNREEAEYTFSMTYEISGNNLNDVMFAFAGEFAKLENGTISRNTVCLHNFDVDTNECAVCGATREVVGTAKTYNASEYPTRFADPGPISVTTDLADGQEVVFKGKFATNSNADAWAGIVTQVWAKNTDCSRGKELCFQQGNNYSLDGAWISNGKSIAGNLTALAGTATLESLAGTNRAGYTFEISVRLEKGMVTITYKAWSGAATGKPTASGVAVYVDVEETALAVSFGPDAVTLEDGITITTYNIVDAD